jgi:hypothetical protein
MSAILAEFAAAKSDASVMTVPGGDVAALYEAVYDENGRPRDNVTIDLATGVFRLDTSQPFGGRLVLGNKTILRSTLKMAVDDRGVPVVNENDEPTVLEEGAKIDSGELAPPVAFIGDGVIVVGDQGLVQQLWVDTGLGPGGSVRPGIEITARGTVRHACVRGHRIGLRVRAAGEEAHGTVAGCLFTNNSAGMIILSLDPGLGHPTGGHVRVEAKIRRNASANNVTINLVIFGGIGSDHNRMDVETSHNLFGGCASLASVRVVGGQNVLTPGSHHNRVKLRSVGDRIVGAAVGLQVEGGALQSESMSGSFSLLERQSSNNKVTVLLAGATFESNLGDIVAYGGISRTTEPGGDHNAVRVVIPHAGSPRLTVKTFDCFPEGNFAACCNKASVE